MSYTITITQTKEQQKEESGNYCVVGRESISASAYTQLSSEERKRFDLDPTGETYSRDQYDYPPKRTVTKIVEMKVFEQTVEALDIKSVIRAVNAGPEFPPAVVSK
jgi:hypothetical protein